MRPRVRALAAAALVLAAAATASAHGGGVIDLEDLEALVASRTGTATGAEFRAWSALSRRLDRPSRRGLVTDLAKIVACLRAYDGALRDDELRALVVDAWGRGAEILVGEPTRIDVLVHGLERARERARVTRLADRGVAKLDAARNVISWLGPTFEAASLHRQAAARFAKAERLGQRFLLRQARRSAPGQPVPKGPSGTIDTYAGSGAQGAGADGVPARASAFYFPYDVAADPSSGLVVVVDSNTHRIRRIDADGRVRTVAGNGRLGDSVGPALQAELHHPSSVDFDRTTGDMLICGWHSARIVRLVAATDTIEYAGGSGLLAFSGDGGPAVDAEFDYPSNVVFLADGSWLVSDPGNLRIRYVSADGTIDTVAGTGDRGNAGDGGPATDATFDFPPGEAEGPVGRVALDPTGRFVYVADTGNHRIRRMDLVARTIDAFAGDGASAWAGDGGPREAASFVTPVDVDCDAAGNVYVCDRGSSTVRRVDLATGTVTTVAGTGVSGYFGDGGAATAARLDAPQGIFVDRVRGRVYVADTFNSVVRVVWE